MVQAKRWAVVIVMVCWAMSAGQALAALPGDVDGNFMVDLADAAALITCLSGPDLAPMLSCQQADTNEDGRVDLADAAELQVGFGCEQGEPEWVVGASCRGGVGGSVYSMINWNNGNGPALFVSGVFTVAGCTSANGIAKWDGASWDQLDGLATSAVLAMLVRDDNLESVLLVAYWDGISYSLGRWNGASWEGLGSIGMRVNALIDFDAGGGQEVYAGGFNYNYAAGTVDGVVTRFDGSAWNQLGGKFNERVNALAVFDDGDGGSLFAGGEFTSVDGNATHYVAKWDGNSWLSLGLGLNGDVNTLVSFDDGSGPALFVGGTFTAVGGVPASGIAKWNGTAWTSMGVGGGAQVSQLNILDLGAGPTLYVAWNTYANLYDSGHVSFWNGTTWNHVGWPGVEHSITALGVVDSNGTQTLVAGGRIVFDAKSTDNNLSQWNGVHWTALGNQCNGRIEDFHVFDDGVGKALYAGGAFTSIGGTDAKGIAKWDGLQWSALGESPDSTVLALADFDDGQGLALYAGGYFRRVGGVAASKIAKWDGSSWSALDFGVFRNVGIAGAVRDLKRFDDGSGAALFAGGDFDYAGGTNAKNIAKWDGTDWSPLGAGIGAYEVLALEVFDDGQGEALYVGGNFSTAGGLPIRNIAKWDGVNWSMVGVGLSNVVLDLMAFDDGSGSALFATSVSGLWKWDGISWIHLLGLHSGEAVHKLGIHDDGRSNSLLMSGVLYAYGGSQTLVRWNENSMELIERINPSAIASFEVGGQKSLWVGGDFEWLSVAGIISSHFATLTSPAVECPSGN